MTQQYDPRTDDILTKNILPSIYGVRLGKDAACKQIWDEAKKKVIVGNHGAVIRLEDLYHIIFKVSE